MITVLTAAALYFLALFGAVLLLGTELIAMPLLLAVVIVAARLIVRRLGVSARPGVRLGMGAIALVLMLAAGYFRTPLETMSASVYYPLLALYALLPLLMQSKRWYSLHAAAIGGVSLAVLFTGLAYAGFLGDLERAERRVESGSEVVSTPCGPIEYAAAGEGPAVLLVHGAGGGFDQGIEYGAELARQGFRVVAMSRFGYLRTPLPADASPQAQADAHACLLDALKIGRAAIVGVSAGAPSTMQFVLRHPQRASAMVLLVPLAFAPSPAAPPAKPSAAARFMFERAVRSDFLYWLAMRVAPGTVVRTILATPPVVVDAASETERARVYRVMEHVLPLRQRQAGLLNDTAIGQSLQRYEVERIAVPTLVISMADDLYGTFESAGYTAAGIRGARFIGYVAGGHLWVGHHRHILDELGAFLSRGGPALARR